MVRCIGYINFRQRGQILGLEYAEGQLKPSAGVNELVPNEIILWTISRMLFLKSALAGRTHRSKILVIMDIYVGASYLETTILAERCEGAKHQQTLPALFKRNASVVIRSSHRYGPHQTKNQRAV